jgi:hypothetical protein
MMFIASSHGNVGGRYDNYVFEAGMHYEFTIGLDDLYDRVDVVVTPLLGEWNQVEVENGAFTTDLIGLEKNTPYVVQVQSVLANGKVTDWSPSVNFTTLGDGEIALYDDLDNQDVIEENDGEVVNVTLSGRKLYKDGTWNTLCLPFNTELTDVLAEATLMELDTEAGSYEHMTGYENGTLYLNFKPADTIEAGKPYIIRWTNASEVIDNPVFEGVTIVGEQAGSVTSTDNGGNTGSVTFVGLYAPEEIFTTEKTNLYMGADNTVYYPWSDDMTSFKVNAFRAYFKLNNGLVCGEPIQEGAGINTYVLNFGNGGTNMIENSIINDNGEGAWYTVDGRKLNNRPTVKGVYINHGRKIVIR